MIAAIITQSLESIDREINALLKEKEAISELENTLTPLVAKLQSLLAIAPAHGEKIKAWIAKELSIDYGTKVSSKSPARKPCPFVEGDTLKVVDVNHDRYGYEFKAVRVRRRGIGYQAFDENGDVFSSTIVEKTTDANTGIDVELPPHETDENASLASEEDKQSVVEPKPEENNKQSPKPTEAEAEAETSILDEAIAALEAAEWKPGHIDFRKSNQITPNGEDAIVIIADRKRPKGYLTVLDNKIKIGSELLSEAYLKDMKGTLETIAPIWEKEELKLIEGINPGHGIKWGMHELSHDDLIGNKLSADRFKREKWQDLAEMLGLPRTGTRKQIGYAICDLYQNSVKAES